MKFSFNLIKDKEVGRLLAVVLISIALVITTIEYIFEVIGVGFYYEDLFAFVFEIVANGGLIFALIKRRSSFIEIMLIVLKAFEGTYYPLRSTQRLDILIRQGGNTIDIVTHILFATFAFMLLIALVFFIHYKVKGSATSWNIMKALLIVAAVAMIVSVILYIFSIISHETEWVEIFEPISLAFLISGMFVTCEYVEEETIYA